jgi:hypothetical protein|tara:strand:- start:1275 stop:1499 length:225 start_codon:yes stop_codon:yes gene_type:complete
MAGRLINKNNLSVGDRVRFSYHDKQRVGTVEVVGEHRNLFTLRHVDETGRKFSNFNFSKIDGRDNAQTGISMLG